MPPTNTLRSGVFCEVSVVIPVFNEKGSVASVVSSTAKVLQTCAYSYEIIVVDDGSTDGTDEVLRQLRDVIVITLRRNFGQTAALDAGIKHASGRIIVTMDGDGQNDPIDIPRLINVLREDNLDIVSGWRKDRHDTWGKRASSRLAAQARKFLLDDNIHDSGCTLKAYRRECFESINLAGEMHRFIPALLAIRGFRVGELVVRHHARVTGTTKYTWSRGVRGLLDMLSLWFWRKYAGRPLHIFGYLGIVLLILASLIGVYVLYQKLLFGADVSETFASTVAMFLFLSGLNLLMLGLVADMLSKNYYVASKTEPYSIRHIKKNDAEVPPQQS